MLLLRHQSPTFYTWLHRFEEHGEDGLRDRSSQPHHSPNATSTEVVGKIIYLRQNYHFGPLKISMYLVDKGYLVELVARCSGGGG